MIVKKYPVFLLLFLSSLLVGGFLLFVLDAIRPATPPPFPPECDGIVVLTGGEDRISVSLHLLQEHPSLYLLISGVAPHVTLSHITRQNAIPLPAALTSHVTLGRRALSTVGNARETTEWAKEKGLHHLLVVTARYHMRRALLELHQATPQLSLIAYPVQPATLTHPFQGAVIGLLIREYAKLVGAIIRDTLVPPGYLHGMKTP